MPTVVPRDSTATRIRELRQQARQADAKRKEMQGRAWRATRAFNQMVPQLTSYVRAVAGDKSLVVRATAGITRTDGRVVWIRPPLRLGDEIKHEKAKCSTRSKVTYRQECPACDLHEMVMACIYHELAHVLFGTMVPPTEAGLKPIHDLIREWHPVDACDHAEQLFRQIAQWAATGDNTYLANAAAFDMRLKLLLNSLEDARVNSAMFTARPGTRAMMDANVAEVFEDGIEGDGETNERWEERDVDSQIFIGLFLVASEYFNHLEQLVDDAREVLAHEEIEPLVMMVARCYTIHEVVELTCRIWQKLQDLGRFVKPKCEKIEEPELPDEPEDMPGLPSDCAGDAGEGGETGDEEGDGDASAGDGPESNSGDRATGSGDGDGRSGSGPAPDSDTADGDDILDTETEEGEDSVDAPDSGAQSGSPDPGNAPDSKPDGTGGGQDDKDPDESVESGGSADQSDHGDANAGGNADADTPDTDASGESSSTTLGSPGATKANQPDDRSDESDQGDQSSPGPGDSTEGSQSDGEEHSTPTGSDGSGDPGQEFEDGELDGEGSERDDVGDSTESLERTARRISLHDLIEKTNPETNTKEFACGHTDKDRAVHLHSEDDEDDDEDENDDYESGTQLPGVGDAGNNEEMLKQLAIAILQSAIFDAPSVYIHGMAVVEYPNRRTSWELDRHEPEWTDPKTFTPGEGVVGRLALAAKLAFEENDRAKYETNLKKGRINGRRLAQRVPDNDPRMFRKKVLPGKRSHHVVITMDCSGSTASSTADGETMINARIKRAVFAQAEYLSRLGISFEIWAHSAGYGNPNIQSDRDDAWGWMLAVKRADQPWDNAAKVRLACVQPTAGNVDGHTLEFCRKRAEESKALKRHICYYTDGAMPAMNHDEELEVLQENIRICERNKINLMAVGIETDSPEAHGFKTVRVDSDDDLIKVVQQLQGAVVQ